MKPKLGAREGLGLALVVVLCLATTLKEPRFLDATSINSVLLWMPLILVAAVGQLPVIVMRGIDISVGSVLGFSGIAVGLILKSNPGLPIPFAFLAGALTGAVLGSVNASLITWAKLPPIVVTIGTLTAFRGLTFLLSQGKQVDSSMVPRNLTTLAKDGLPLGGVAFSYLLLIAIFVAILGAVGLRYTQMGRDIFAYGSNPNAAYLRGVPINKATFWAYTLCGATAGLAGVMYAARFGFVNPGTAGQNFELTVIAAVAIGGVKITGGYGSIAGAVIGCLLLSCLNVALSVLGIDANWQMLAYGAVILAALLIDSGIRMTRKEAVAA